MSRQPLLQLSLPSRPAKEFLVFDSNRMAADALAQWPSHDDRGLQRCAILSGESGSGKSLLAAQWARLHQAQILPPDSLSDALTDLNRQMSHDASPLYLLFDPIPTQNLTAILEQQLFHLINQVTANNGALLLTERQNPIDWDITLPDLRSRLLAMNLYRLGAAEDDLLRALTVQSFREFQIAVEPELIDYILNRSVRSPAALTQLVARLNEEGLRQGRAVTIQLAREVFSASTAEENPKAFL